MREVCHISRRLLEYRQYNLHTFIRSEVLPAQVPSRFAYEMELVYDGTLTTATRRYIYPVP
jgi:hypothetical protein